MSSRKRRSATPSRVADSDEPAVDARSSRCWPRGRARRGEAGRGAISAVGRRRRGGEGRRRDLSAVLVAERRARGRRTHGRWRSTPKPTVRDETVNDLFTRRSSRSRCSSRHVRRDVARQYFASAWRSDCVLVMAGGSPGCAWSRRLAGGQDAHNKFVRPKTQPARTAPPILVARKVECAGRRAPRHREALSVTDAVAAARARVRSSPRARTASALGGAAARVATRVVRPELRRRPPWLHASGLAAHLTRRRARTQVAMGGRESDVRPRARRRRRAR